MLSFILLTHDRRALGPVHHLVNMRPPTTPTTAGRRKSSIRPVARTSDVDFDKIPSPRPLHSTQRSSKNAGPGPSSLSHSVRAREVEPDSDSPNEDAGDIYGDYNNMDNGGFDDYAPDETRTPTQASAQKKKSFGRIDEDVEESEGEEGGGQESEPEPEPEPPQESRSKQKQVNGKQKAPAREPSEESQEEEFEAEIAQGLEDVGLDPGSDEEEEETPQPPPKKAKVVPEKKPPGPKTASRGKKENKPLREGVRRSQREHYAPLEYWRGEKLVYGRSRNSGPILVPQIKEIVRIPKEHSLPLGGKRKRGSTRARSRSQAVDAEEDAIPPALPVVNPEEGWDDDTQAVCTVVHYTSKEEVERRMYLS
jgi:centromere protein C